MNIGAYHIFIMVFVFTLSLSSNMGVCCSFYPPHSYTCIIFPCTAVLAISEVYDVLTHNYDHLEKKERRVSKRASTYDGKWCPTVRFKKMDEIINVCIGGTHVKGISTSTSSTRTISLLLIISQEGSTQVCVFFATWTNQRQLDDTRRGNTGAPWDLRWHHHWFSVSTPRRIVHIPPMSS